MKKIEEAARKFYDDNYGPQYNPTDAFLAGSRYVLDAMTSEAAVETAVNSTNYIWMYEARKILSAVRREIEGE